MFHYKIQSDASLRNNFELAGGPTMLKIILVPEFWELLKQTFTKPEEV